jgi:hypothetical protein
MSVGVMKDYKLRDLQLVHTGSLRPGCCEYYTRMIIAQVFSLLFFFKLQKGLNIFHLLVKTQIFS